MAKAVLKNGVIRPLEPLPPEWADGQELEAFVAQNDPQDLARVNQALRVANAEAKALVRKQIELS